MYQPKLGQFMSRDPMPENGVTVLSPVPDMRKHNQQQIKRREHAYVYSRNNPINRSDPSGLQSYPVGLPPDVIDVLDELDQSVKHLIFWLRRCGDIPCHLCAPIGGAIALAQLRAKGIPGGDDVFGGNPLRHCLATCHAARLCGEDCARDFWDGREDPESLSSQQDLANNVIGYDGAPSDGRTCYRYCTDEWNAGNFTCTVNNALTPCPPGSDNYDL